MTYDAQEQVCKIEALARAGSPYFALAWIEQYTDGGGVLSAPLRELKTRLLAGEFGDSDILTSLSKEKMIELEAMAGNGNPVGALTWIQNFQESNPVYGSIEHLQTLKEKLLSGEFGNVSNAIY